MSVHCKGREQQTKIMRTDLTGDDSEPDDSRDREGAAQDAERLPWERTAAMDAGKGLEGAGLLRLEVSCSSQLLQPCIISLLSMSTPLVMRQTCNNVSKLLCDTWWASSMSGADRLARHQGAAV